jgi:formylglycine-generating enzyme required for sulfatase activity
MATAIAEAPASATATAMAPATAPVAETATATATSTAAAMAAPEQAKPSARGRCPAGMTEYGAGKFKSTYYRAEQEVSPYCLDDNLTTAEQYTACVASGGCDKTAVHACDPSTFGVEGREKFPMTCVDFNQAERYCKAQGKRLPTDVEWEWAARGGEEARAYPWGADAPGEQLCWSGKTPRKMPCPIGTYAQGDKGVFDLVGNVGQWTTTTNDPTSSFRGARGGSWKDGLPAQVAVKARGGFKATYRCGFVGIRCAAAVP